MKVVKKTNEWSILQKRSGRYAVRGADRKFVSGDEKLKILAAAGLAAKPAKKAAPKPDAAPEAEAEAESATPEEAETPSE